MEKNHAMNQDSFAKNSNGSNSSDGNGTSALSESESLDDDARNSDDDGKHTDDSNQQHVPDNRSTQMNTLVGGLDETASEHEIVFQEDSCQHIFADDQDDPPASKSSQGDGCLASSAPNEAPEAFKNNNLIDSLRASGAAQSSNLGGYEQQSNNDDLPPGSRFDAGENLASAVNVQEPTNLHNRGGFENGEPPSAATATSATPRSQRRGRRQRNEIRTEADGRQPGFTEGVGGATPRTISSDSPREAGPVVDGSYAERVRRKLSSFPGVTASIPATALSDVVASDHDDVGSSQSEFSAVLNPTAAGGTSMELSSSQGIPDSERTIETICSIVTAENSSSTVNTPTPVVPSNEPVTPPSVDTSYAARLQRKRNQAGRPRTCSPASLPSLGVSSQQLSGEAPPARSQSMFQSTPMRKLSAQPSPKPNTNTTAPIFPGDVDRSGSAGENANLPRELSSSVNALQMSSRSLASTGMDEGDKFVATLSTRNETSTVPNGTIRPAQRTRPAAMQLQRTQESFSYLPAESRGDYISGGQGVLMSDNTPGAFQAQGRAFGNVPEWIRNPRNNSMPPVGNTERAALLTQISSRSLPDSILVSDATDRVDSENLRELRMSMPQGSFTVRAHYQGRDSNAGNFDGLAEAEARLLERVASKAIIEEAIEEVNEEEDEEEDGTSETQVVLSPPDAAYEAAAIDSDAILSAEEVTNEEVVKEATAKATVRIIYATVAILTALLVALLVILSVGKDNPTPTVTPPEPSALFPRSKSLPERDTMCEAAPSDIFDDFSPVVECYCGREIPGIPAEIIESHSYLVRLLLANGIINYPPLATECSDPLNMAILWMAEAEPLARSVDESIARFLLAVLFHSLGGLDWFDNTFWLTNRSECAWHGIRCNSFYVIEQIQLPENGLVGAIPEKVSEFLYLRTLNVTGNRNVAGDIPDQVKRLITDGKLHVYTNDTSVNTTTTTSRSGENGGA